jgi:general secretion pathway protein C
MPLPVIAKRYFPVLLLMLAAIASYFQARGLTRLIESALGIGASKAAHSTGAVSSALPEAKSGRDILERNPFDSVAGPLTAPVGVSLDPGAPTPSADPLSWPDCEGVQVLIVTESKDPWWSMTTLREPGEPRARLRRVGDSVAGKQVAFIGYNPKQQVPAVWLEGRGTYCQSTLFWKAPPAERSVARSVVNQTIEQPLSLLRSVRVVPEQKDGKLVGLRLFGIRSGSLLGALGLKNGDRLESINGFSVASPEKALEAYARLRTASRLDVRLNRVGKPVDLSLNIN